jgi:hypothetical protein
MLNFSSFKRPFLLHRWTRNCYCERFQINWGRLCNET